MKNNIINEREKIEPIQKRNKRVKKKLLNISHSLVNKKTKKKIKNIINLKSYLKKLYIIQIICILII